MKKIQRIFIVVLVLFLSVGVVLYFALNTPIVSRPFLRQFIQKNLKDYKVQSLTLGRQQFVFPNVLVFRQLEVVMISKDPQAPQKTGKIKLNEAAIVRNNSKNFDIRLKGLKVKFAEAGIQGADLQIQVNLKLEKIKGRVFVEKLGVGHYQFADLWATFLATPAQGFLKDISFKGYDGELKGEMAWVKESSSVTRGKLDFQGTNFVYQKRYKINQPSLKAAAIIERNKMKDLQGYLKVAQLTMGPAVMNNLVSNISGDETKVRLTNINADAYEGNITGEILLEYQPPFLYSMALDVHQMSFRSLEGINSAVFSQFEGVLDGNIRVAGDQTKVRTIESEFSVPGGGKARAALMAYLLQYVPEGTQQREMIDLLLSTDGKISAEEISLNLKNVESNKISGIYKVYSKQLNLNVNQSFDLNLDGEVVSLIEAASKIMDGLTALINPSPRKEGL